nr:hypothetical protein [Tanacetum cinerariifolium]
TAPLAVPTSLSFQKPPVDKVPVLRVQHQPGISPTNPYYYDVKTAKFYGIKSMLNG